MTRTHSSAKSAARAVRSSTKKVPREGRREALVRRDPLGRAGGRSPGRVRAAGRSLREAVRRARKKRSALAREERRATAREERRATARKRRRRSARGERRVAGRTSTGGA